MNVGAVRYDGNPRRLDAAPLQHARHGLRDGDDPCCTIVLPARARIPPQREIDAARDDQWRGRPQGRQRAQCHRVAGVSEHEVNFGAPHGLAERPRRPQIQLTGRIAHQDG